MSEARQMRIALGQIRQVDDEMLRFATQLGVTGLQLFPDPTKPEPYWTYEHLMQLQAQCAGYGLRLESVAMHLYSGLMLGLPNRDEQIEDCCKTIRNMGAAGVPILGYDFMPNSVWRTSMTQPGRGGAKATAFDLAIVESTPVSERRQYSISSDPQVDDTCRRGAEREVDAEAMWDNYDYFLRAVLPVAEEAGVRLAVHPDDPPVPSLGGIARIFSSVEGYKRAMEMANSDAWGILLCLGSCSEMPGGSDNVREMIEFFGPRDKICYVHFRDVQGSVPSFAECFVGEGNFDAAEMMRLLDANGFNGFLMDDHVPHIEGDTPWGHRARSHAVGYMQALMSTLV